MRSLLLIAAGSICISCSADPEASPEGPAGITPADPTDPVICIGDPDSTLTCKKSSEFWDCTTMPNAQVKCNLKEPLEPDGTHTWSCTEKDGVITCTTSTPGVTGSGGWKCVSDAKGTTCTMEAPAPPSGPTGGGSYNCGYSGEFTWSCTGSTTESPSTPPPTPSTPPAPGGDTVCYDVVPGTTSVKPPEGWWAKLSATKVLLNGVPAVHVQLTLTKAYVDNTYGAYAIGYAGATSIGKHHSLGDLLESDKNEFFLGNAKGDLVLDFDLDYFSVSPKHPSGYGCLGVTGGEGHMYKGDPADILAAQTSLGTNFNAYGYKLTQDSPKTDLKYTPDPKYPKWIFEVQYEFWARLSAFGPTGPGKIYITGLHASPNKVNIKPLPLTPGKCP